MNKFKLIIAFLFMFTGSLYATPQIEIENLQTEKIYVSLNSSASQPIRSEYSLLLNLEKISTLGVDKVSLIGADSNGDQVLVGDVWIANTIPPAAKCDVIAKGNLYSGESVEYCLVLNKEQMSVDMVTNFSEGKFILRTVG
ncbi:hypothetical protein [Francisella sp. SYW-2]|uniref:hypothetical protein n=1 Tax=Francisella sp. SYW-2 TaxID=2610886 RepID=UPI00123CAED9|nr:hypothetical protein [Francisella sp. SYW-2]